MKTVGIAFLIFQPQNDSVSVKKFQSALIVLTLGRSPKSNILYSSMNKIFIINKFGCNRMMNVREVAY